MDESVLREKLQGEVGRVSWRPLVPHQQRGHLWLLEDLDLDSIDGIDEGRLESALSAMAGTLDKVDDDPRQAVQAMRRLLEDSGLKMGRTMEEAVRRLEAGEDVEAVEADLSEVMEEDQLFAARPGNIFTAIRQRYLPPRIDPTLYELDSPS